ncbi:MAG TPA: hypothetical protein VGF59_32520 [Bryobacteraceae bacterium]
MNRHAPGWFGVLIAPLLMAQTPAGLTIRVLEGDGAINSIRLRRAHDPVIQVLDRTGEPVRNATVTFLLPATGPSGEFGDSGLSVTMQTGQDGKATARSLKPNRVPGQFRIRVTASAAGQAASATLLQTNAEPVAQSSASKKAVIIAIIGGAAAAGVVAATHGGKSSSGPETGGSTGSIPAASIIPGTPVLGPPH